MYGQSNVTDKIPYRGGLLKRILGTIYFFMLRCHFLLNERKKITRYVRMTIFVIYLGNSCDGERDTLGRLYVLAHRVQGHHFKGQSEQNNRFSRGV